MSCITGHRKLRTAKQGPLVLFLLVVLRTDPISIPLPDPPTAYTHAVYSHRYPESSSFIENINHVFLFGGRTNAGFFKTPFVSAAREFRLSAYIQMYPDYSRLYACFSLICIGMMEQK